MNKQTLTILAVAALLVAALLVFENPFKEEERAPRPEEQVELFVLPAEDELSRIELRGFGTSTTLVRKGHQWFTKEGFRADASRVPQILSILKESGRPDLISVSPDAFINFKVDQMLGISLRMYDIQNALKVDLIVGETERDFFHTPVRKPDSSNIYSIRGMLRPILQQADWRDRNIFRIDLGAVRRVRVRRPEESYVVERESQGAPWHLSEPTSAPLSPEKVQGWLQQLCMLNAQDLEPPATTDTLTSFGLTASKSRISIGLEAGTTQTLVFGAANARKEYYIQRGDDPQVFRLAEFYCTNLLKKSDDLKPTPPVPPMPVEAQGTSPITSPIVPKKALPSAPPGKVVMPSPATKSSSPVAPTKIPTKSVTKAPKPSSTSPTKAVARPTTSAVPKATPKKAPKKAKAESAGK